MPYTPIQLASRYISYRLKAGNSRGHGMHSPFVYAFIRELLQDRKQYPEYAKLEAFRSQLRSNRETIDVLDLGAGSGNGGGRQRTVASIARNAAKSRKFAQLLFRMARHYRPQTMLELGTSLGISSAYLQLGNPAARLLTLEGAPAIADMARKNFRELGLERIEQITGNFGDTLPGALQQLGKVDLAFIDGNHRYQPTLHYFNSILPYTHNESILVFDDIHWSREMEQAWSEIKANPLTRCSIDLFTIGIVFLRREFYQPQHFSIGY